MNYTDYKLGEVTENLDFIRVPLSKQERAKKNGEYRYYGAQEIIDYVDDYLFDGEYLLVAEDGNNLISSVKPLCALVNGKFWVNNHAHILKGNELANTKYLLYLLNSINIKPYVTGSAQPKLNQANLNRIKIKLPLKVEQDNIAMQIGYFDDKLKLNMELISDLEEYSQLMFHKWFVDYNFPDKNCEPYKDSGGKMVQIDGKTLPEGWIINTISSLVDKESKTLTPKDSPTEIFKYYSIPIYDVTNMYSLELGSKIGSNKYIVDSKKLLVSKLNPWFKRVVYPYNIDEAICSTEYVVWQPNEEGLLEYLYVLSKSNNFTEYNTRASSGTSNSHKRVNPDYMLKYNIKYNLEIIKRFNDLIKPLIIKLFSLYEENQLFEETRDLLIKKLIR